MKKRWDMFRVLRGVVYIHTAVCAVSLVGISASMSEAASTRASGLGAIDASIVWTLHHPYVFYWALLAFDLVSIYILHSSHQARRKVALRCYMIAVPVVAILHIVIVTIASFRGTIQSPAATYVMEGFGVLRTVAIGDIVLAVPLALTLFAERMRLTGRHLVCTACGYDLAGLSCNRCPECGVGVKA